MQSKVVLRLAAANSVAAYGKGLITYLTADMGTEEIKSDNVSQAIVRHDFVRRGGSHEDVIGRNGGMRPILRKRRLIQPAGDGRAGTEIVLLPVVSGDEGEHFAGSKFCCDGESGPGSWKLSAQHRNWFPCAGREAPS